METIFVVCLTTLTVLVAGQDILEPPVNTAQSTGERVRLNCTATLGTDFLEWQHFLDGGTGERIWFSQDSGQPSDPRFEIEQEGDHYDLIIPSVTMSEAGKYACRLLVVDIHAEAEVVVLDNFGCEPLILPPPYPPNPPDIIEGGVMVFRCSVQGDGYKAPMLQWWNMNGQVTSDYNFDPVTNTASAMANVTATGSVDHVMFECRLFFVRGVDEIKEPPRYEDSCTSYYDVKYGPQDIEISPDPDETEGNILNLFTGDHVNCSASSNPEPTYSWYEKDLGTYFPVQTLTITAEMADRPEFPVTWVCRVKNMIAGNEREAEREVKMNIDIE